MLVLLCHAGALRRGVPFAHRSPGALRRRGPGRKPARDPRRVVRNRDAPSVLLTVLAFAFIARGAPPDGSHDRRGSPPEQFALVALPFLAIAMSSDGAKATLLARARFSRGSSRSASFRLRSGTPPRSGTTRSSTARRPTGHRYGLPASWSTRRSRRPLRQLPVPPARSVVWAPSRRGWHDAVEVRALWIGAAGFAVSDLLLLYLGRVFPELVPALAFDCRARFFFACFARAETLRREAEDARAAHEVLCWLSATTGEKTRPENPLERPLRASSAYCRDLPASRIGRHSSRSVGRREVDETVMTVGAPWIADELRAPDSVARGRVECHEPAAYVSHVDPSPPDGGRGVDVVPASGPTRALPLEAPKA